jgi:hypothetical protein
MGASVITSGTSQASTSGTSIDFTSIPSWVKRINVIFNGVSKSSTAVFLVQIGTSSGIEATGYLGSGSIMTAVVSTAAYTTGFGINSSGATSVTVGILTIANITSNTWVASGTLADTDGGRTLTTGGGKTLTGVLDRVRITTNSTDTFDAGSINILYE